MSVAKERQAVVKEDKNDLLTQLLPLLLVASVAWTINAVFFSFGSEVHEPAVKIARDSGLRMSLKQPLNEMWLAVHALTGMGLLFLVMSQKWSIQFGYAKIHRYVGYVVLAISLTMSISGFLLGAASSWVHFDTFSFFFALPWFFWAVVIYATARYRYWRLHRLFANQMFKVRFGGFFFVLCKQFFQKGVLTVPISRLAGGFIQRHFPGISEAAGYYLGIFGVVIVVAFWEAMVIRQLLSREKIKM